MRLKLQNASTGVQKFLVTDASTLTGLLAAVTARLGVDCLRLCVDEVRIEDDADVATLQDGDIVQVFELVGVTAENDQVIADTDVTEPLINAEFTESPGVTKKSSSTFKQRTSRISDASTAVPETTSPYGILRNVDLFASWYACSEWYGRRHKPSKRCMRCF